MPQWGYMKNLTRLLIITIFVSMPIAVSAQSNPAVDALIAQTQALMQKIDAIQAQANASSASIGGAASAAAGSSSGTLMCPALTRALGIGSSGSDVTSLQRFLAQDPAVYPEGSVTGYYGPLTQTAVQRWQAKHGIVSSGTPATTGYGKVGPKTMAAMRESCGGVSSSVSVPVVSGVIQVTPVNGTAPLTVTISATVNITGSCTGGSYMLDYGDGTAMQQIVAPAGSCAQLNKNFTHAYQSAGVYTVALSSGSHKSSAIVTVSGGSAGSSSTTTQDSIVASVTSGAAPLTVTFTGTVNAADAGSCTSNCSDQINFGDGTTVAVPLPVTQTGYQSTTSYTATHTYNSAGTYAATLSKTSSGGQLQPVANAIVTVTGGSAATSTSAGVYSIISVATGVGGNQSAVSIQISYPACASYVVDWGDGFQSQSGTGSTTGCSGQNNKVTLNHNYGQNGTVTIRLTDGDGVQRATATLTISNVGTMSGYGIVSVTPGVGANARTVAAQLTVPACPSYSLDWGDSTTPTSQSAATGCTGTASQSPTFTHSYAQGGIYLIKLKDATSTLQSSSSVNLPN